MLCVGKYVLFPHFSYLFRVQTQKNFPFPVQTGSPLLSISSVYRCHRTISKNRSPNTFHKEL